MRFANSVISSLFFISNSITVRAAILVIFSLTDKYIDSFYINSTLYHTDQTLVRQSPLLGKSYPDSREYPWRSIFPDLPRASRIAYVPRKNPPPPGLRSLGRSALLSRRSRRRRCLLAHASSNPVGLASPPAGSRLYNADKHRYPPHGYKRKRPYARSGIFHEADQLLEILFRLAGMTHHQGGA